MCLNRSRAGYSSSNRESYSRFPLLLQSGHILRKLLAVWKVAARFCVSAGAVVTAAATAAAIVVPLDLVLVRVLVIVL